MGWGTRTHKSRFSDGDEDGVVWIPNKFLTDDILGGTSYAPITQLWRNDDSPEFIRFRDGILVIWRHA